MKRLTFILTFSLLTLEKPAAAVGFCEFYLKDLENRTIPVNVHPGYGVNLDFSQLERGISQAWLDDVSRLVISADGDLCGVTQECDREAKNSILHLKQINPISFPELPKSADGGTLLTVIAENSHTRNLFQFKVIPKSGVPQTCTTLRFKPNPPPLPLPIIARDTPTRSTTKPIATENTSTPAPATPSTASTEQNRVTANTSKEESAIPPSTNKEETNGTITSSDRDPEPIPKTQPNTVLDPKLNPTTEPTTAKEKESEATTEATTAPEEQLSPAAESTAQKEPETLEATSNQKESAAISSNVANPTKEKDNITLANDLSYGLLVAGHKKQINYGTTTYKQVQNVIRTLRQGKTLEIALKQTKLQSRLIQQLLEWGQYRSGGG